MVDIIIAEIKQALENKMYIVALSSALTLPDICGKAEFPGKGTKSRYLSWGEKYIESRNHLEYEYSAINGMDIKTIYELRCSLLHQGTPNIEKDLYFELVCDQCERAKQFHYYTESFYKPTADGQNIREVQTISVNVVFLCNLLCDSAEKYWKENCQKFDFINYNIVTCDYHTAKLFGISPSAIQYYDNHPRSNDSGS